MNSALVSVVIPAYNCADYLEETLTSALAQTYEQIEVIVVDDGSTDKTPDILASYGSRIGVIRQANQGVSVARNEGIRLARGAFIAFLDSDDLWCPEKIELQVNLFKRDPSVDVVFSNWSSFGEPWPYATAFDEFASRMVHTKTRPAFPDGHVLSPPSLFEDFVSLGPNPVLTSATVVRRRCFDVVGFFNEQYRIPSHEDIHMWIRLAKYFNFAYVDRVLAKRRRVSKYTWKVGDENERWIFNETIKMLEDLNGWLPLTAREQRVVKNRLAIYHFAAGYFEFSRFSSKQARVHLKASLQKTFSFKAIYYFALTFFPVFVLDCLRGLKRRIIPV